MSSLCVLCRCLQSSQFAYETTTPMLNTSDPSLPITVVTMRSPAGWLIGLSYCCITLLDQFWWIEYCELENLLHGFNCPSVMDCKIGVRTYLEDELVKAEKSPTPRKVRQLPVLSSRPYKEKTGYKLQACWGLIAFEMQVKTVHAGLKWNNVYFSLAKIWLKLPSAPYNVEGWLWRNENRTNIWQALHTITLGCIHILIIAFSLRCAHSHILIQ